MTAMTTLPFRPDGWTVDDLQLIPDDVPYRYELVDGGLLVTPPPDLRHAEAADALRQLLRDHLPSGLRVLTDPGVYVDRRNYRQPDVAVYRRGERRDRMQVQDVVLAVEVVSPSSVTTDRVTKPAQYAAAGIPHFWRFELDPALLVTHALAAGVYHESGRFSDEVDVREPVALRFRLADLLPR
jgi:Uma2 family endonuclease